MEKLLYFELEIQQGKMARKTSHVGMKCHQLQPKGITVIFIWPFGLTVITSYHKNMGKISGRGCSDKIKIFALTVNLSKAFPSDFGSGYQLKLFIISLMDIKIQ